METYEVNKDTVALVPKDKNQTIVYEVDKTIVVNKPPLSIMEDSCEYFGSTLEGRQTGTSKMIGYTHKVPIVVEESFGLIFFPTHSPKNQDCSWISYQHIYKPSKYEDKSILELKNGKKLMVDVSSASLENQLYRASRLKDTISTRKIEKNNEKATKR